MQESRLCNRMKDYNGKINQVVSVVALLARSSFYKILVVLAVMTVAEILAFRKCLYQCFDRVTGMVTAPERVLEDAYIHVFFLLALGICMIILFWTETYMSEKAGYTMMRLRLSRRQIFAIKTIYNAACIATLFILQICLAVWMIYSYGMFVTYQAPGGQLLVEQVDLVAPQLYFLTFYRNEFLHCLLPMQEIGKWVRNILMIAALSMNAAGALAYPGEKGRNKYTGVCCLCIVTMTWFVNDAGKNLLDMVCDLLYAGCVAFELLKIYGVFGRLEAEREVE